MCVLLVVFYRRMFTRIQTPHHTFGRHHFAGRVSLVAAAHEIDHQLFYIVFSPVQIFPCSCSRSHISNRRFINIYFLYDVSTNDIEDTIHRSVHNPDNRILTQPYPIRRLNELVVTGNYKIQPVQPSTAATASIVTNELINYQFHPNDHTIRRSTHSDHHTTSV